MCRLTCIIHDPVEALFEGPTCVYESVVTERQDGEHASVGRRPEGMRRRFAVSFDETSAQVEPDDAEQDVGEGKEAGKEAVQVVRSVEEHRLPPRVLPQEIHSRRRENHRQITDGVDKEPVDEDRVFPPEFLPRKGGEGGPHRERPEDVYLDHCSRGSRQFSTYTLSVHGNVQQEYSSTVYSDVYETTDVHSRVLQENAFRRVDASRLNP